MSVADKIDLSDGHSAIEIDKSDKVEFLGKPNT